MNTEVLNVKKLTPIDDLPLHTENKKKLKLPQRLKAGLKEQRFGLAPAPVFPPLTDVVTVLTNISGVDQIFGFLGPHGKDLAVGGVYTQQGDIVNSFTTGGGRVWKRKLDGYNRAVANSKLSSIIQNRIILRGVVNSDVVIAAGDLVYLDSGDNSIKPASLFTWTTDLATTQAAFKLVFMGVALDAHLAGTAVSNFRVDTSSQSIYSFNCVSATYVIGTPLSANVNGTNDGLLNTTLVECVANLKIATSQVDLETSAVKIFATITSSV